MRKLHAAAAPTVLLALSAAATAATCSVNVTPMAFGVYTPVGGPAKSSSSLQVTCTAGTFFAIGASSGSSGTVAQRLLTNGGAGRLQYNLYVNNTATPTIWGDGSGTGGSSIFSTTSTSSTVPVAFTVYGILPDNTFNQSALPGNYTDAILVVVSF